jgi:uncharacterized protein
LRITPIDVNTPTNYWWKLSGQTLTLGNRDGSTNYGIEKGENSFKLALNGGQAIMYNCAVDANLYTAQPSFQCVGNLSWVEKTICNDESLASQDRQLASLSQDLLAGGDREDVRRINDRWREEWDRCGGSGSLQGCLGWVYREWLEELQSLRTMAQVEETPNDSRVDPQAGPRRAPPPTRAADMPQANPASNVT